jgi:hypothetical protein
MKFPLVAILASQLVFPPPVSADPVQYEDLKKIAVVMEKLSIAWRFGDSAEWMEPFDVGAYFTVLYDEEDSEMTAWNYEFIFDYFQADTVFDLSMRQIRLVRPDVVVVELNGFYLDTDEETDGETDTREYLIPTATLKRTNTDWKVVSFTNTPFVVNEHRANDGLGRFKRISAKKFDKQ